MMQTSLELQTLLVVHGVNNRFFSNKHIVTCSFINTAIMFSLLALLDHTIVWLQEQKCVKSKWVQEHDSSMRSSQEFTLEALVVQSRLRLQADYWGCYRKKVWLSLPPRSVKAMWEHESTKAAQECESIWVVLKYFHWTLFKKILKPTTSCVRDQDVST